MHSTLVRAQNVFGFFTTVAFTVAALAALSVLLSPQDPSASISIRNLQVVKGRPHYYSTEKNEYAHIKFDLDANFTSLFNWNTKQLFVYVLATYPSHDPLTIPPSEAVIWDLIIPSSSQIHPFNPIQFLWSKNTALPPKSRKPISSKAPPKAGPAPGVISLRNAKPKYQITDISGLIAEKDNVTLEVGWNVQPWVGALTWANTEGRFGGKWKALQGGRSQPFDLPPLKGKTSSTAKRAETPRAAEASPIL